MEKIVKQDDIEFQAAHLLQAIICGVHFYWVIMAEEEGSFDPFAIDMNKPAYAYLVDSIERALEIAANYNVPLYDEDGYEVVNCPGELL